MFKSVMLRSYFSGKEKRISIQDFSEDVFMQFLCIIFNIAWRIGKIITIINWDIVPLLNSSLNCLSHWRMQVLPCFTTFSFNVSKNM